jgi:hypothetical protein
MEYNDIVKAIETSCEKTNVQFMNKIDGRLESAIKESEYLKELKKVMDDEYPLISFVIPNPKSRKWYDVSISNIPINLKFTNGGTDNVFNKISVFFSITGEECKNNMNFQEWYEILSLTPRKKIRNRMSEYHFLVIEKNTKNILLKSIFDIKNYKTNPCNILQINWKNEFLNRNYLIDDEIYPLKILELLSTIQKSLKQEYESKKSFIHANLEKLF